MRGKLWPLALVLALLPGCGERAGLESAPAGEEVSAPVETDSPFGALPVTEEGIWNYYLHEMNGYYMIRGITAYEGDYLVELGEGNEGSTMLEWIFGDTGRKVQMTTMGNRREVEIQGRGGAAHSHRRRGYRWGMDRHSQKLYGHCPGGGRVCR